MKGDAFIILESTRCNRTWRKKNSMSLLWCGSFRNMSEHQSSPEHGLAVLHTHFALETAMNGSGMKIFNFLKLLNNIQQRIYGTTTITRSLNSK